MNAQRRKAIDDVLARIAELDQLRQSITEDVQAIMDEEKDYFDNMADSFQNGSKGETAQEAIGNLESAVSDLESIDMDSVTSALESAKA